MTQALYISAIKVPGQSTFAASAYQDFYKLHRLVTMGFADSAAATAARILYRFDQEGDVGHLYIQSKHKPDWSRVIAAFKVPVSGPAELVIPEGDQLRFRLLAKPSYRIGKKDSKFKGVRTTISDPVAQLEWLQRKGEAGGFKVLECQLLERTWFDSKANEKLENGAPKPLYGVQFDGILAVTDRTLLVDTIANGIGTQKAYGFGLLSLAKLEP